ncbi:MAG TPA: hypothetical protein EYP10_14795, partial [Armatimonadetes bacterium]|nr:hypothetical protein [Armatimonadota bacterium]
TISIGMDSVEQVKGNVQLAEAFAPLTDEERAILQREAEELGKVFCRRCEYCQPCPAKIPISSILMLDMFRVRDGLDRLVTVFNAEQWLERAEGCEDCGACEERCPYGLPIRDLIRQYTERYRPLFAETKQRLGLS